MIDIKQQRDCCGCHACTSVCPRHCITMQPDSEGFLYPAVDKENCINCGLCELVCPIINQSEIRNPIEVYAAKNQDDEIRIQSSSGGIFSLLARKIISEGGIVFGARFDDNWNVIHDWTDTFDGIAAFRGSKYVQSIIGNSYNEAKNFLQSGRKVLFTGTPCQIAGLKRFLRKNYDNLLTVDVVCHGVPSPLVWKEYLAELYNSSNKFYKHIFIHSRNISKISDISFRDKTKGWKKYRFSVIRKDGTRLIEPSYKNLFMKGFLANLYLRPSCHHCPARSGRSTSDITMGDFWGIKEYYPKYDDDKGVSLLLIYSNEGKNIYDSIKTDYILTDYNYGLRSNPCIEHSVTEPQCRADFWLKYNQHGLSVVNKYIKSPSPITDMYCKIVKRIKRLMK